jgi:hypothetical protein
LAAAPAVFLTNANDKKTLIIMQKHCSNFVHCVVGNNLNHILAVAVAASIVNFR